MYSSSCGRGMPSAWCVWKNVLCTIYTDSRTHLSYRIMASFWACMPSYVPSCWISCCWKLSAAIQNCIRCRAPSCSMNCNITTHHHSVQHQHHHHHYVIIISSSSSSCSTLFLTAFIQYYNFIAKGWEQKERIMMPSSPTHTFTPIIIIRRHLRHRKTLHVEEKENHTEMGQTFCIHWYWFTSHECH